MKNIIAIAAAALLAACSTVGPTGGAGNLAGFAAETKRAREACFEVVVQKPTADSLSYEKPLNWDLQSYNDRVDKYMPLGTAFAISRTQLVTAAHVLMLTSDSLTFGRRYIRARTSGGDSAAEQVYEIDQILAYNFERDFAVFTVKGKTFDVWLEQAQAPGFNKKVYTAGDAYGEGIVVREGMLLDSVPESRNGAWRLLKSSVATNPGSSGGPLLDESFRAVGIVLGSKDDFCYSLPLAEVVAGRAIVQMENINFSFSNFSQTTSDTFKAEWALPMGYGELIGKIADSFTVFSEKSMERLFTENAAETFPRGASSLEALEQYPGTSFPEIYLRDSGTGKWFLSDVEISTTDVGSGGSVAVAEIYKDADVYLVRLDAPDGTPARALFDQPQLAMEVLLRGIKFTRKLSENDPGSRIISFGKPLRLSEFSDAWGRPWRLCVFLLEYSDEVVVTCATPTPQGLSMLYVARSSARLASWLYDTRRLADFVAVSYSGTLKEWADFLGHADVRVGALGGASLIVGEGGEFELDTQSVVWRMPRGLLGDSPDTTLSLICSVLPKDGQPVLEVRKFLASAGGSRNDYCTFFRWSKPSEALPKEYRDWWKNLLERGHPYSGKIYTEDGQTNVGILHPAFVRNGKAFVTGDLAYSLFASREGTVAEEELLKYMSDFTDGVKIR